LYQSNPSSAKNSNFKTVDIIEHKFNITHTHTVFVLQALLLNLSELAPPIGNESVLIQLAQCWFSGLAISKAKTLIYFQIKYTEKILSKSICKLLWFEITKMLIAV